MKQFETDDINKAAALISLDNFASNIYEKNKKIIFVFDDVDDKVLDGLKLEKLKINMTKFLQARTTIYELIKNVK